MAAVRITVEYEGAEHTLAFARNSEAISVERAICIACGVPWGSVTRLVDATGAVYSADPTLFPDGKKLALEVVAIPQPLELPAPLLPPTAIQPGPEEQPQDDSIQPEPEQPLGELPEPIKVVVVGACGVGKTTWISRLKSKNPKKYKMSKEDHEFPTVGAEVTTIEMPTSRGTKKKPHSVTLKVWEVSGSDDQAGIRPTYYSGAHAAVILFKVASNSETTKAPLQTYWEVLRWHNEVVQACGKDLPIIVIGVGADLEAKFPQELLTSTPCIKVSNKTGSNAYQPANYVMQTLSGDPALRAKKDGSKVELTPADTHWHSIVSHICGTYADWSVN